MLSLTWVSPPYSENIALLVPFQIRDVALTLFVCACMHVVCVQVCGGECSHVCLYMWKSEENLEYPSLDTAHLMFLRQDLCGCLLS